VAKGQGRAVAFIVIIAIMALGAVTYWQRDRIWSDDSEPTAPEPKPERPAGNSQDPSTQATAPPPPVKVVEATAAQRRQAQALFDEGVKLLNADKVLAARAKLADALVTGALNDQAAAGARDRLAVIAEKTIFSSRTTKGDRCTFWYRFRPGDIMDKVVREQKLRVPSDILLKINKIADARKIRAGQQVKLFRGPVHAVVSKSRFTMDLYLTEPGTQRMIFIKRLPVGTGKDGSTPVGRWRVALGGKIAHATWTPPSSSDVERKKIPLGTAGYPLGRRGLWISLEGIEDNHLTKHDGYGIHGTNDPASIGKAVSMGCIRLDDEGIDLVFSLLYEKWSTVTITE